MHRGIESQKLTYFLKGFTNIVELVINEVDPKIRSITASETLPAEEKLAALQTLDKFGARAMSIRDELASLLSWLQSPPPQFDLSLITDENGQLKGHYEDLESILTRLKAGGDI